MILSKQDYLLFLKQEIKIDGSQLLLNLVSFMIKPEPVAYFIFLLRTSEYYMNVKPGLLSRSVHVFIKYLKYKQGLKCGFSIPENVFDSGLQIPHYGTIIVNANARVGKNCRLHACTNIGASGGSGKAPQIGDNVYIAPGVKIYGDITIANNTTFAVNAAVGDSILEEGYLVGGVPAKVIKRYDNRSILKLKE